jgi:hypothetical protein
LPLPPVVVIKAGSKLARVVANNIVCAAVVALGSAEDVDTNMVFRQRISVSRKGTLAYVSQKTRQQRRLHKMTAGDDSFQQRPLFCVLCLDLKMHGGWNCCAHASEKNKLRWALMGRIARQKIIFHPLTQGKARSEPAFLTSFLQ